VGPHPGQARQAIFELGQLYLQSALTRLCVAREYIKYHARAVNDFGIERLFEIALLSWRQLLIKHEHIGLELLLAAPDLVELTFSDEGRGVATIELLSNAADDIYTSCGGELLKLIQRITQAPELLPDFYANKQGFLNGFLCCDKIAIDVTRPPFCMSTGTTTKIWDVLGLLHPALPFKPFYCRINLRVRHSE